MRKYTDVWFHHIPTDSPMHFIDYLVYYGKKHEDDEIPFASFLCYITAFEYACRTIAEKRSTNNKSYEKLGDAIEFLNKDLGIKPDFPEETKTCLEKINELRNDFNHSGRLRNYPWPHRNDLQYILGVINFLKENAPE